MVNPERDGLPAMRTYTGPKGEERLLFNGIEAVTSGIARGWAVSKEDIRFYRGMFQRLQGLIGALDHRIEMQGGNDD